MKWLQMMGDRSEKMKRVFEKIILDEMNQRESRAKLMINSKDFQGSTRCELTLK